MTLIVIAGFPDCVVAVADRRISVERKRLYDEYNKLGIVACKDARFAMAFTGLATSPIFRYQLDARTWPQRDHPQIDPKVPYNFAVGRWMLVAVGSAARPANYQLDGMIEGFRAAATAKWAERGETAGACFCMAGFRYDADHQSAQPFHATVSNLDDPASDFVLVAVQSSGLSITRFARVGGELCRYGAVRG